MMHIGQPIISLDLRCNKDYSLFLLLLDPVPFHMYMIWNSQHILTGLSNTKTYITYLLLYIMFLHAGL